MNKIFDNAVFQDWFSPMLNALQQVRHPNKTYTSLPINDFIALGCLRQMLSINTLREQIQQLFHLDGMTTQLPIALGPMPWPPVPVSTYCANDLTLEPGLIAFLYYRRWDEEKYFDAFKNDLASSQAWGKSQVSIEQQGILGIVTYLLTRLFLVKTSGQLGLDEDKKLQLPRHKKKLDEYIETAHGIGLRAFYRETSKITKQVWRFLRGNFIRKACKQLYERQLRLILTGYL